MTDSLSKYNVIGLGELLWDIFPTGKKFGGAPANFAFHAQNLGAEGNIISAVGDDELGRDILLHLRTLKLSTEYVQVDRNHPTGSVEVKLDSEGKPDYIIHQDVAWDYISLNERTKSLVKSANAICFGSLAQRSAVSGDTIRELLSITDKKCIKVFDINLRQSFFNETIIKASLERCDCLKLNDDELPVVMKYFSLHGSEVGVLRKLISIFSLSLIALTKGANGSLLVTSDEFSSLKTPKVKIADTVGAGDAFTAALVMGLLRGLPIKHIHKNANQLAAYVCTQNGATPSLPSEIKAELTIS
jgi:fructokinase